VPYLTVRSIPPTDELAIVAGSASRSTVLLASFILFFLGARHVAAASPDREVQRLPVIDKQDIRFIPLSAAGEPFKKRVLSIAQDNYGFMWLGTDDGLYRYDGHTFRPYRHDPANSHSLSDNTVMTVLKDRVGILWIGTGYGGLDRFDPAQDVFTHSRHDPNDSHSLSDDHILCIYQDLAGSIWIGTTDGLNRLDRADGHFLQYRLPSQDGPRNNNIWALYEESKGSFLVGTGQGLYKLDGYTGRFSHFSNSSFAGSALDNQQVGLLFQDRLRALWVGSGDVNGFGAFNPASRAFTYYPLDSSRLPDPQSVGVIRMQEDRNGDLWIGTMRNGLLKLDKERKHIIRYSPEANTGPSGQIWSIFEDAEGSIWVGSESGVSRFQSSPPFSTYRHEAGNPDSLRSNKVLSVHADASGFLWIGTDEGLQRLDRNSGQMVLYQHEPRVPGSLSNNAVTAIKEDGSGGLWVGTHGGGLNRFDRRSGRFTVYSHNPNDPLSLSSDIIMCLLPEPGGVLWVGTEGGGLNRFDPPSGRFKAYRNDSRIPTSLSSDLVRAVLRDKSGTLWVGTNQGLNRFDREMDRFTVYFHGEHDPASISHEGIDAIHEDRQGNLWIGTRRGLDRVDEKRGSFEAFTIRDGLADDYIEAMQEDSSGNLWLATHEGLSELRKQTKTFQNYSQADGLPGDFQNPGGGELSDVSPAGELVFGSAHGLTVFNPNRVAVNTFRPPVVLTDFLLFNQPVVPSAKSPLRQPIWATHAITLDHEQNIFTLEFASLSYVAPERNRYRYKLEGLEKDWNEVGEDRRLATYNSLPPRKYVFRVQGSNDDLVWNETGVHLDITVLPPWWATWWFRSIAFLSAACLVFAAYQWRIRSLRFAAHRLEIQVDQRTRELRLARDAAETANRAKSAFLAHMSHELRTPLNAILGFSRLMRDNEASAKQREDLDRINRSGEHLLSLINNVLDLAKVESGRAELHIEACDLKRLVDEIMEMMGVRAREKNLALRLHTAPEFPRVAKTDAGKLRQVLINLLGNAIKFTEKGFVELRLSSRAAEGAQHVLLTFEVEDTGIGISPEDQQRIFDAFAQVGKQGIQKGTGLGLTISRQFVELMGGTIEIASAPGKGTCFRVELPVEPAEESDVASSQNDDELTVGVETGQRDYRVLIVEDGEDNRLLLQRLMQHAGFQVRLAGDGLQGVEVFQSWRPHFIWMDLRMPVMDGKEAARRIRMLDGGKDVKIVAVTASAFVSEREEVLAAGVDDFIRKPYKLGEIFDCIARHLGLRRIYKKLRQEEQLVPLGKEDLKALPLDLIRELRTVVVTLDQERIRDVIARISDCDSKLGQKLTYFADRSAYTAVLVAAEFSDDEFFGGVPNGGVTK
jgi:signal transduction histidine kinase/ligand-binding sensor domain-containing protein/CheY-like chemotaxis protein